MNNKLTDKEIVKELERYSDVSDSDITTTNERLKEDNEIKSSKRANIFEIVNAFERGKAEAYKEFAEKAKEFMHNKFKALDEYEFEYITERDIDNLIKEIIGE